MSDFRLTDVVTQWLVEQAWEERPEKNETNQTSRTNFGIQISEDFGTRVFMDVNEKAGFFKLFMYDLEHKIPVPKLPKVVEWANLVNIESPLGHVAVLVGDQRSLRYHIAMDFENAAFEPAHIDNMLAAASRIMAERIPQMLAICYGNLSPADAVNYELGEEPTGSDEVPDAL